MPFVTLPGVTGKIFVPERKSRVPCKNPCPDCFCCQFCSDDRCNVCIGAQEKSDDRIRPAVSIGAADCKLIPPEK